MNDPVGLVLWSTLAASFAGLAWVLWDVIRIERRRVLSPVPQLSDYAAQMNAAALEGMAADRLLYPPEPVSTPWWDPEGNSIKW